VDDLWPLNGSYLVPVLEDCTDVLQYFGSSLAVVPVTILKGLWLQLLPGFCLEHYIDVLNTSTSTKGPHQSEAPVGAALPTRSRWYMVNQHSNCVIVSLLGYIG
jgi:hypothetical protein